MEKTEDRLKQLLSYERIKQIFDALDEGIIIVDKDYRILFYNKTLNRFEGLDSTSVVGKKLLEVFPSLTPKESTIYQVIKTGQPLFNRFQQYFNYKGREIKTINTTIPIIENGNIAGALEISRDITEIYVLSEKVKELQQKLIGNKQKKNNVGLKYSFDNIIGKNKKIRNIIEVLKKVSKTTSSVLIYGETGTGKELFAQSIHAESPRCSKPFIAQNCAALPETLIEAILFGTTRGSFTGAEDKPGLFEQADGGTLLLDEINCMGLSLQSKLLRVLQEGVVRRIGATRDIPVDVRIIATTNIQPAELLKQGKLRNDLFYRLGVVCIEIPPLRERMDDLQDLVEFFIDKYNRKFGKNIKGIDEEVLAIFREYSWPGNIRELEHVIEGVMNYVDEGIIRARDLKFLSFGSFKNYIEKRPSSEKNMQSKIDEYERKLIIQVLKTTRGNITKAADKLGMKRQSLQYRLKKYGIKKDEFFQ